MDMISSAMIGLFFGRHMQHRGEGAFYRALIDQLGGIVKTSDFPFAAGTDGRKVYVNPEFAEKWGQATTIGLLAHEARHLLQNTAGRGKNKQHVVYNIASDLVINESLKASGFTLPADGVFLSTLDKFCGDKKVVGQIKKMFKVDDTTEEQVYQLLMQAAPQCQMVVDVIPGDGSPEAETRQKIAVAVAGEIAKAVGSVPSWLEREIGEIFREETPWPDEIRDWFNSFSDADLSWSNPDRVVLANYTMVMPDFRSEALGEIAIIIDTSGSISQDILDTFAGHISAGIAQTCPEKLHIIYADAAVAHVDTITKPTSVTLKARGGGGTDFRPAFDWITQNAPGCVGAVYFTDGYGEFPKDEPLPTLWCLMEGTTTEVPWGRKVIVKV